MKAILAVEILPAIAKDESLPSRFVVPRSSNRIRCETRLPRSLPSVRKVVSIKIDAGFVVPYYFTQGLTGNEANSWKRWIETLIWSTRNHAFPRFPAL